MLVPTVESTRSRARERALATRGAASIRVRLGRERRRAPSRGRTSLSATRPDELVGGALRQLDLVSLGRKPRRHGTPQCKSALAAAVNVELECVGDVVLVRQQDRTSAAVEVDLEEIHKKG